MSLRPCRLVTPTSLFSSQRVSAGKSELWGGIVTRLLTRCWVAAASALHTHHMERLHLDEEASIKRIALAMAALLTWDVSAFGASVARLVRLRCLAALFQGDRATERLGQWSYGADNDIFVSVKERSEWWPAILVHGSNAHVPADDDAEAMNVLESPEFLRGGEE